MKKLIFVLALAAAAYFFAWPRLKLAINPRYTELARSRVENVLKAMGEARSAIVRLRIEGSKYTWIVPEKSPIAWGENSRS